MHVELHRKFRELIKDPAGPGTDQAPLMPSANTLDWDGLLTQHRVVILSEAGAGKTQEIRQATQRLRALGKQAFFLRLENIASSFETAFEEGDLEEFEQWIASSQEGWMLLDSIDEARLQSPKDFENALRTLSLRLKPALQRCHLVITGRNAAWRPFSDLELCASRLPFTAPQTLAGEPSASNIGKTIGMRAISGRAMGAEVYRLYALEELSREQVQLYANARATADVELLFQELDRSDGWAFTTRPLDLEELLDYWQRKRSIGSRLDFLQESIERRLQESDQDRAERTPLTLQRAREGARRIAAACTLTRQQTIAVPDGSRHEHGRGLRLDVVLPDWPPEEQAALLQRPIFDEEIYGTVRFHHRVVREYLTAEWMAQLLEHNASRAAVEELIFRTQYGLEVINPTTRSVLPWLALLDNRIQQRALRIAPNALLEDGDPSKLPTETRRNVLKSLCAALNAGAPPIYSDYTAIQRFAATDLTEDIQVLLRQYKQEDIQDFLLRMVWQGRLLGTLDEVLRIANSANASTSTRIYAIRALDAIGTAEDRAAVRDAVVENPTEQDRRLVAELLDHAPATEITLEWLVRCAQKIPIALRYSVDSLSVRSKEFVDKFQPGVSAVAVDCFWQLLDQAPYVRPRECEVSRQHAWLLGPAGRAIRTLINARHPGALQISALKVLARLPRAQSYDVSSGRADIQELGTLVAGWPDLLFALFWHLIEQAREAPEQLRGPVVNFWDAHLWGTFVKFQPRHFDRAADEVAARPLLDDKLVAFSLAFNLFSNGGRPPEQVERLQQVCKDQPPEVARRLEEYLNPPPMNAVMRRLRRQEAVYNGRSERETAKQAENLDASRTYLQAHLDEIRAVNYSGSEPVGAQSWLYEQMHLIGKESSSWGAGDWTTLEPTFGADIAHAYRDGLQHYWRRHRPQLVSEGASASSFELPDILGLGGITIESQEVPQWWSRLTPDEVDIAFRYAMRELNGFPAWFPSLFQHAPESTRTWLLKEVDFELTLSSPNRKPHYVLANIAYVGHWLWDALGGDLLLRLQEGEDMNSTTRRHLLDIVQGSCVSDERIARVAQFQCTRSQQQEHAAQWYAVWTGVDPSEAISALQGYLETRATGEDRTTVMTHYLVSLTGARHEQTSRVRKAYVTTAQLKTLYLMAHEYVRRAEDIERAGTGVYSPGFRDDAQDARENLLAALRAQTGKEAFIALSDIALHHPHLASRPYFAQYAHEQAQLACAGAPWSEAQAWQFQQTQESTPATHRQLYDLAVRRLEDLKHSLEQSDSSNAPMLALVAAEKHIRVYIGEWLRDRAGGRYSATQEEEFADAKRADIRFLGKGFDAPVPIELKLANNWTGPKLFERLENQLCGDYLRDNRSSCGIFLLVYRGEPEKTWQLPGMRATVDFTGLVRGLQERWATLAPTLPQVHEISIIGIDLTRRTS